MQNAKKTRKKGYFYVSLEYYNRSLKRKVENPNSYDIYFNDYDNTSKSSTHLDIRIFYKGLLKEIFKGV